MDVDVIVGKNGVTESLIEEIKRRLKKKKYIKVKLLRSSLVSEDLDRKELSKRIADQVGAELVGVKGRTFILRRKAKVNNQ